MSALIAATVRVGLVRLSNSAAYYRSDHEPLDRQAVEVFLGRDRFNDMGKPGYLDATITVADAVLSANATP